MFPCVKDGDCKCLIIKKYNASSFFWNNLIKKTPQFFSTEEIVQNYQGFEGEVKYFSNLKNFEDLNGESNITSNEALLFLIRSECPSLQFIRDRSEKMGYDYGICEGEQAIYSSIFNEILFGTQVELVQYRNLLNGNLIFPSQNIAEEYAKEHHELLLRNRDVESDEDMNVYEIWKAIQLNQKD